ncbi:MAG: hypothetical protein LQ338_004001 [Usnochroma carphineum]|nr:MAG: hypothetical protein LQ338_004001 [Usnochroma carphineum]
MSSDDAYTSFLEQANQDTSGSKASAKSNTATTKAVDTEVPTGLQNVEQYYTSEADEPFEPGACADEFAELIGHDSEVSTMNTVKFDPRGRYKEVLQAVEKAGDGKSRIYRVVHGKTRLEYYVVGLEKENKRVVGLRAKAVES